MTEEKYPQMTEKWNEKIKENVVYYKIIDIK